jgi:hypothetical protein
MDLYKKITLVIFAWLVISILALCVINTEDDDE